MRKPSLDKPTPDFVRQWIARFEGDEQAFSSDRAIAWLVSKLPLNENLEDILLKVSAINSLYSTNIYATYRVSRHICDLHIDSRLRAGDPSLVKDIALVKLSDDVERYNYSFATKYCSWHAPEMYPIYDRIVEQMIVWYREDDSFAPEFTRQRLWDDYNLFRETIIGFRNHYGLNEFSFKQLDKFLWKYGRYILDLDSKGQGQ
jgi:hypothetical protein